MDEILRAIAEPRRRKILGLVSASELSAGEIAACFAVSRPAISQHLRVLIDAGLVTVRKHGTRRLYRLCPERLKELRAFLDGFWGESLNQLKSAAESAEMREGKEPPDGNEN